MAMIKALITIAGVLALLMGFSGSAKGWGSSAGLRAAS
jgi:hypothetical protein